MMDLTHHLCDRPPHELVLPGDPRMLAMFPLGVVVGKGFSGTSANYTDQAGLTLTAPAGARWLNVQAVAAGGKGDYVTPSLYPCGGGGSAYAEVMVDLNLLGVTQFWLEVPSVNSAPSDDVAPSTILRATDSSGAILLRAAGGGNPKSTNSTYGYGGQVADSVGDILRKGGDAFTDFSTQGRGGGAAWEFSDGGNAASGAGGPSGGSPAGGENADYGGGGSLGNSGRKGLARVRFLPAAAVGPSLDPMSSGWGFSPLGAVAGSGSYTSMSPLEGSSSLRLIAGNYDTSDPGGVIATKSLSGFAGKRKLIMYAASTVPNTAGGRLSRLFTGYNENGNTWGQLAALTLTGGLPYRPKLAQAIGVTGPSGAPWYRYVFTLPSGLSDTQSVQIQFQAGSSGGATDTNSAELYVNKLFLY
jgi:hypothetical protein